ncbi:MAG: hypothetical protein GY720_07015 [bacterium]|nr:hypothetical protein [bacterium]
MRRTIVIVVLLGSTLVAGTATAADQHIEGTVLGPTGNPAIGACATLLEHRPGNTPVLESIQYIGPDGSYRFGILFPGTYIVKFNQCFRVIPDDQYPYVDEWYNNASESSPTIIPVRGGETVSGIDATLAFKPDHGPELGTVKLKVVDETGAPVPGVLLKPYQDGWWRDARTDDQGETWVFADPGGSIRYFIYGGDLPSVWYSADGSYAPEYESAAVVEVPVGPGTLDLGRVTVPEGLGELQAGLRDHVDMGTTNINVANPIGFEMELAIAQRDTRLAILSVGQSTNINSREFWAFTAPGEESQVDVEFLFHDSILTPDEQGLSLAAFHYGAELAMCASSTPTEPCVAVLERYGRYSILDGVRIRISGTTGGIFTFGDQPTFFDARRSIFHSDIEWLGASGITKGCNPPENTMFCPDDVVTRGQMAAFLVRALNLTDDGAGNLFDDDDTSIFEASINKLATAGITKGCNPPDNTMFCPDEYVTRAQMAAFLVRAMGYADDGGGDLFADDDGNIFETAIDKLATAGVTRGCNPAEGNTRFCPDEYVTRGQMAAFLHRALG